MKKALSLILALILCAALASPAYAANLGTVKSITIEAPDKSIKVTLTNVADKVVADDYGYVWFFMYDGGTLKFSRDVTVYSATENGQTYAGVIKGGQTYTIKEYDSAIEKLVSVPGSSSWSYSIDSPLEPISISSYDNYKNMGAVKDISVYAVDGAAPPPSDPVAGADAWAKAELSEALALGIVPASVSSPGWTKSTSRVAAAEAIVAVIEKSLGKTAEQIAAQKGWDLSKNQFSDTSNKAVTFLKYAGVTNGVGNNKYDPNGDYTRAQTVTMIGRTAEVFFGVAAQGANPFSDVPAWAAPYVGYAADNGITNGVGGGKFDSDGILQNQHTAIFMLRTFNVWK